jgi:hypothetical protein
MVEQKISCQPGRVDPVKKKTFFFFFYVAKNPKKKKFEHLF